jgi:predicted metal-dependent hydrolase
MSDTGVAALSQIQNEFPSLDPHYLAFFEHFNQGRFFEAHEVLEVIWLPQRQQANGRFYQGLIQLAGAFLHWQKRRVGPAKALFELARANLRQYPNTYQHLNLQALLQRVEKWMTQLEKDSDGAEAGGDVPQPRLALERAGGG